MDSFRFLLGVLTLTAVMLLAGCSSGYLLQGRVVQGEFGSIGFVPIDDPRLNEPGIPGVKIVIHRDGDKPSRRKVAEGSSTADGGIATAIDEFGAGWMVERWLVECYKPGYETVEAIVSLPARSDPRRLLITLAPGPARPLRTQSDLMDQYNRFR